MKIVYVLSTDGWTRYAQMAYVSASTVRRIHPDAELVLLTDEFSQRALEREPNALADVFDQTVVVETGEPDVRTRSRFLKTSMRQHIDGDFVFLDVDTLLIKPLDGLEACQADVGAVVEWNGLDPRTFPPKSVPLYEKLGWRCPTPSYFNSGVMLFRDTPAARELGEEWHRRWKLTVPEGFVTDQQSLNSAINETNVVIEVLPNEFNSMVLFYPWLFRASRVAHFFESNDVGHTLFRQLLNGVDKTGEIDWAAYDYSIANGHPWGSNPEAWQLWRSRNYVLAVRRKFGGMIAGRSRHQLTPTL